jgi:aminoglycoside N3'-acetyltransferase
MAKLIKQVEPSIVEHPSWSFKVNGKHYLVFTKDDSLKVTLDGEIVFDKFQSKLSYIEWIKTINKIV